MEEQIHQALAVLRRGGLVGYPTDTVYGLGGNALDPRAVQRTYAVKGRAAHMPLPLLVADMDMLRRVAAALPPEALTLARRFFPGPLTLVLLRSSWVPSIVSAGQPTVAVRISGHPVPGALSAGLGAPIIGTSANRSGQPSVTTGQAVRRQLGALVDYVIDGECPGGVESTVVDLTQAPPRVLRHGALPVEAIEEALRGAVAR